MGKSVEQERKEWEEYYEGKAFRPSAFRYDFETDQTAIGTFEWIITFFFVFVPLLNVITLPILIYFDTNNTSKQNFYFAVLVVYIILYLFII